MLFLRLLLAVHTLGFAKKIEKSFTFIFLKSMAETNVFEYRVRHFSFRIIENDSDYRKHSIEGNFNLSGHDTDDVRPVLIVGNTKLRGMRNVFMNTRYWGLIMKNWVAHI